ncbi:hypothetical protein BAUCODRAFT_163477 [Baudoinia panamericana UAMH 10762]|uniref:FAD-binding domain-containing protein n=1 Tax=Baudoinia panamericana (strain UAMH 10762) TaxID=717646 RepID=M2NMJ4_BAUPA|nr:uncharacterized protein BAUCODRAFT_163477 [Baudoinia panamericana UAMH 10762]EMD00406.1 hypothetical protein BAUCODRAFT_163477 [Baudoinia panamericana UAMH 10762]
MHIIVVGAGLGGLSAALCFALHDHTVTLLEQRPDLSPQGNGINIRPGASRIMHSWGLRNDLEAISEICPTFLLRSTTTGEITMRSMLYEASEYPDWSTMRRDVVVMLYRKVVEAGVKVRFGVRVRDVRESVGQATLTTESGERLDADLILAADGVRSRIRRHILADVTDSTEPIVSDTTFYGVCVPSCAIQTRGTEMHRVTNHDHDIPVDCWLGRNRFVVSRWSPRHGFVALYGIKGENDMKGMWDADGNISYIREAFSGSCDDLTIPLSLAETCDRWKLAEMPDLPRWTSTGGRVVLLGDSAHAMHPNAAQGFSQIIEDIGVLDYLITRAGPNATREMQSITRTWQNIRKPRVERIKEYAKFNTNLFVNAPAPSAAETGESVSSGEVKANVRSLKDVQPRMEAHFQSAAFVKWALDYDAIAAAKEYLGGAKL